MTQTVQTTAQLPHTLAEFLDWEPNDGLKHEWNDGELITFTGMQKKQYYIYDILTRLFFENGYVKGGTLMAEPDVMLTGIQMRRPDIAYFTREQIQESRDGVDVIPEFVIEVISESDKMYKTEEKLTEYFKAGVLVVWYILPESEVVHVYRSRKNVQICTDNDVCSASPVLPEFEITVNGIFQ